jgi:DNA-directed RNA polymerase specialized sigma24 family protein
MYLQGYAREEIAQLLRWSEAKTRNLLYRGLDDLKRQLEARGIHQ